jgi:hypothetical protein
MLAKRSSSLSTTVPSRRPPRSSRFRSATPTPRSRSHSSSRPRLLASSARLSMSTRLRPGARVGCLTQVRRSMTTPQPPKAMSSSSTSATTLLFLSRTSAGLNPPSVTLQAAALLEPCRLPTTRHRHRPTKATLLLARKPSRLPRMMLLSTQSPCLLLRPRPTRTALSSPPLLLPTRNKTRTRYQTVLRRPPPIATNIARFFCVRTVCISP